MTGYTNAAPITVSFGTKQVLARLALAENKEGHYLGGTNFPAGAKLVALSNNGVDGPDFQVVNSKNQFLVDVSDIMSVKAADDIFVVSGKSSNKYTDSVAGNDLYTPSQTGKAIFTLTYDDTGAFGGSGIQFYLTGLGTAVSTDTTPNSITLVYKETDSFSIPQSAGSGTYFGTPLVVTGSLSASGSGNLTAVLDQ